ncbi:MAG: hypothetical protein EBU62_03045 [Proteobacteria bacterium]|nr:hypothetical protein [Pseudomonadota bacterium]NDE08852.1 hypothetical protein [Chloroflexota bacterium]
MVVQNTGWLPTRVTRRARDIQVVGGVCDELEIPDGQRSVSVNLQDDAGQAEDRANKALAPTRRPCDPTDDRAKLEWVVIGIVGQSACIGASHPRAEKARASMILA